MFHGGLGFKRHLDVRLNFFWSCRRKWPQGTGAPGTGARNAGAPADFVTIDLYRPDHRPGLSCPVDAIELLLRAATLAVGDVVVDGPTIFSEVFALVSIFPRSDRRYAPIYLPLPEARSFFSALAAASARFKPGSQRHCLPSTSFVGPPKYVKVAEKSPRSIGQAGRFRAQQN